ncbi:hypothetical protein [Streptococcus oralis]|uniref:Uncharacterized protein n=1 Tax=Streptococcus oralis TaxID=1303 RepID=A0A139P849_STROR|nr:hypothetical protein [Streptococcus oralis]KXT84258.1 hypothetical protein SORDD16_01829 [Streptococcus oralis]
MISERDYNEIVDRVYHVDSKKTKRKPISEGMNILDGQFKVITKPVDNTSNGMQAMAIASVDKNGNADYSHVVIAYAGTNKDDIKDLGTDVQSLGLGRDKLQSRSGLNSAKVVDSQFVTALDYANVN